MAGARAAAGAVAPEDRPTPSTSSWAPSTARHSSSRAAPAVPAPSSLQTTIPSMASAATAPNGRPRTRTATTQSSGGLRWIERSSWSERGGLWKLGTLKPRSRAAAASARTVRTKRPDASRLRRSTPRSVRDGVAPPRCGRLRTGDASTSRSGAGRWVRGVAGMCPASQGGVTVMLFGPVVRAWIRLGV